MPLRIFRHPNPFSKLTSDALPYQQISKQVGVQGTSVFDDEKSIRYFHYGITDRCVIVCQQSDEICHLRIYQLQGFRIRSLTVEYPHDDHGVSDGKASEVLRLNVTGMPRVGRHQTRLVLCSENRKDSNTHKIDSAPNTSDPNPTARKPYLDACVLFQNPRLWLSPLSTSIRRLKLCELQTTYSLEGLVLPHLEVLEFRWCNPCVLRGGHFPSLTEYSESTILRKEILSQGETGNIGLLDPAKRGCLF